MCSSLLYNISLSSPSEGSIPRNAFLYICLDHGLINPDHRRVLYEDSSATPTFPNPSEQDDPDLHFQS